MKFFFSIPTRLGTYSRPSGPSFFCFFVVLRVVCIACIDCVCVVACFTAIEFFGEMVNIQNCNVPPVSFSLQVIISLKKKSPVKKIVNVVIIIYLYDGI